MNSSVVLLQLSNFTRWDISLSYVWLAFIAHISLSFLLSLLLLKFTKKHKYWLLVYLYFLILQFFIPILGHLIVLVIVWILRISKQKDTNRVFGVLDLPEYEINLATSPKQSVVKSLYYQFTSSEKPTDTRLKALEAIKQLPPKASISIIKEVLDDKLDDVRLAAYSLIDANEKKINDEIYLLMREFELARDDKTKAETAKKLSQRYWDLVYIGLVEGDIKKFALNESKKYAFIAHEIDNSDKMLSMLIGKVNMALGAYNEASKAFENAIRLGAPRDRILPYFAEIAFYQRRFDIVRNCFKEYSEAFNFMPGVFQVAKYWRGKKVEG